MNAFRTLGLSVAALALGLGSPALAQGSGQTADPVQRQGGPASDGQTASQSQVRAIEGSLRQSADQLGAAGSGTTPPNYDQARVAVRAGRSLMARLPTEQQNGAAVHGAAEALKAAEDSLEGERPDPRRVSATLRATADALAAVHGDLTAAAPNAGPQQGAAGGARRPGG